MKLLKQRGSHGASEVRNNSVSRRNYSRFVGRTRRFGRGASRPGAQGGTQSGTAECPGGPFGAVPRQV